MTRGAVGAGGEPRRRVKVRSVPEAAPGPQAAQETLLDDAAARESRPAQRRPVRRRFRSSRRQGSLAAPWLVLGVAAIALLAAFGGRAFNRSSKAPACARPRASGFAPVAQPFARVAGTKTVFMLPARPPELVGIGFHQSYNAGSRELIPLVSWLAEDDATEAARRVKEGWGEGVVVFQMNSRGRGTGARTAIDVAVLAGTWVVSPVSGTVTLVKHYKMYGRYDDLHVEIRPDGEPGLRVVAVHLKDLAVSEGDALEGGKTVIGRPRPFGFARQIDRYLGRIAEHVHFQVNPYRGSS